MNVYITFGQQHLHRINGKIFDKDCVALIKAEDHGKAREIAFDHFGSIFCTSQVGDDWWEENSHYFPRGIIEL